MCGHTGYLGLRGGDETGLLTGEGTYDAHGSMDAG